MIWPSSMAPSSQMEKMIIPLIPQPISVCSQKLRYLTDTGPEKKGELLLELVKCQVFEEQNIWFIGINVAWV